MHMCLCVDCIDRYKPPPAPTPYNMYLARKAAEPCPVCRSSITDVKKVFTV
jgi:hypothetical protein